MGQFGAKTEDAPIFFMAPARSRRATLQTPPDPRQRCALAHTTAPAARLRQRIGPPILQSERCCMPAGREAACRGSAATGSLTCRVRQSRRVSFQVLCQPNPAPDLIGKRLAGLHALERRDQILAANQKRAAGLVAAKLVQQADGGAAAHFAAVFLSWRDRRRGQGRSGAARGRWQAGETTGASGAFWVESY